MFALQGNPLPDISTGAPLEVLRINAAGDGLEWVAITPGSDYTALVNGSANAVAGGTYTASAAFAAHRILRIRVIITNKNAGAGGAVHMRVNAEAGNIYNYWTSGAAEVAATAQAQFVIGQVNPSCVESFYIIMQGKGTSANGLGGTIVGAYDNQNGGIVYRNLAVADGGVAAGIVGVSFTCAQNYDVQYWVDYDTNMG